MAEKNENEMSQDEAIQELIRKRFQERMNQVQTETQQPNQQPNQQVFDPTTHCKHGMPLERFCKTCDLITPEQVQDSKPIGVTRPSAPNQWKVPPAPKKED